MAAPREGQLKDGFIIRVFKLNPPREAGILVDTDSKDRKYQYGQGTWRVDFCYFVGTNGCTAFTQEIPKTSGPGPSTLSGNFNPTVPEDRIENPPNSNLFEDPDWDHVFFANLRGTVPPITPTITPLPDADAVTV